MRFLVSFIIPQDGNTLYGAAGTSGENGGLGKIVEAASAAAAAAVMRDTFNPQNGYPVTTQVRVIAADDVIFFPLVFTINVSSAAAYVEPPAA